MRKERGITLVSLVVTIIILIILAGVSINLTLGENGIISKAKQAKAETEKAKLNEEIALNELYMQIEAEGSNGDNSNVYIEKLAEFKKAIADYIEEAGGIKPEYTADTITFGDSIKGIVKEVTKDATAIADNMTEGKTAWVNGELVTGNGNDNREYYNKGYSDALIKEPGGLDPATIMKTMSVMYNHKSVVETVQYVDTPTNGTVWTSSVSNSNDNVVKYGPTRSSKTDLIPLYKTDSAGNLYLLYSISYYFNRYRNGVGYGSFPGGLTMYLYDKNGNLIQSYSYSNPGGGQTLNDQVGTFTLFAYNISTDAVYVSFYLRCGVKKSSSHSGTPSWGIDVQNRLSLNYYTAAD